MRGGLACCVMLAAACSAPAPKPTFDIAVVKPTPDGETAALTGWFELEERSFKLYPSMSKPAGDAACLSGVLLSLAGMPPPEYTNRPMTISGYVYGATDEANAGAANPCGSSVIIQAVDVMTPEG